MKKLICMLLVCVLMLSILPAAYAAEEKSLFPGQAVPGKVMPELKLPASMFSRAQERYENEPNDTPDWELCEFLQNEDAMVCSMDGYDEDYFYFEISVKSTVAIVAGSTCDSLICAAFDPTNEIQYDCESEYDYEQGLYLDYIVLTLEPGGYYIGAMDMYYETGEYIYAMALVIQEAEQEHVHQWNDGETVTDPTCSQPGSVIYTCQSCGESYTEEIPPVADNHIYVEAGFVAPTCTEAGIVKYTCSICGDEYMDENLYAPLGHDFVDGICTVCGTEFGKHFIDVTESAYFYNPVLWAVEKGITAGFSDLEFGSFQIAQRCQVVTFLWRAAGQPEPESTVNPFKDVNESHYFYKAVLWAVEKGITTGTSADTFSPYAECERCQVVTFLWRAAGNPEPISTVNPFEDVNEGHYFYKPVLWAVEKGITSGTDSTHFSPFNKCERCQIVTFLYRAAQAESAEG